MLAGSEFSGTIDAAPDYVADLLRAPARSTGDVPDNEKLTVFAPIDSAFDGNDFAQESAVKAEVGSPQSFVFCLWEFCYALFVCAISLCTARYYIHTIHT